MKKAMVQGLCLVFLMSRFEKTPTKAEEYFELKDWLQASAEHARAILRKEEPLDMEAYENLYYALMDLADWYRIDLIYDT